jgi:hypothetical protein
MERENRTNNKVFLRWQFHRDEKIYQKDVTKIDVERMELLHCKEVNQQEIFYVPDVLNNQKCMHLRFGDRSIAKLLSKCSSLDENSPSTED